MRHPEIDPGERDEEQHDYDTEGLDRPQLGELGDRDAADLPGEDGPDERDVSTEAHEGTQSGLVADGHHVEGADDDHPAERDGEDAAEDGAATGGRIEVGEANRGGGDPILAGQPRGELQPEGGSPVFEGGSPVSIATRR